jgi:hypothetical protein
MRLTSRNRAPISAYNGKATPKGGPNEAGDLTACPTRDALMQKPAFTGSKHSSRRLTARLARLKCFVKVTSLLFVKMFYPHFCDAVAASTIW